MAASQLRSSFVHAKDGLRLAVDEAGERGKPAVVFVHGYAQSRASWRQVLSGPLAEELHLIAYDLRGHGDSETPPVERCTVEQLGADLAAVIESLGGATPIVAPWSYGGVSVGEYLRQGGRQLSGLWLLAASNAIGRSARPLFGSAMNNHARALLSADPATYEAGARAFLTETTSAALSPEVIEDSLAEMLRVPAHVRSALLSKDQDYLEELATCGLPISILHGRGDLVVLPAMSERVIARVPEARGVWLDDVGHLPWLEAPQVFAAELRALVKRARR